MSTHFPNVDTHTRQEHPFRSQLPRPIPSETPAEPSAPSYRKPPPVAPLDKKQETRWDTFSGEPTDSEKGKVASARPGVAPIEVQYPQLKERTKQILQNIRENSELAKKPGWGKAPPPVDNLDHPAHREPWKGASGRAALLEPVKNTPAARLEPLHIPKRNTNQTYAVSNEAARSHSTNPPETQAPSPERKAPTIRPVASQDSIKPVVPLKLGSNNNSRVTSPILPMTAIAEQTNNLRSPFKSPQHTFLHAVHESVTRPMEQDLVESPTDNEPLTPTTPTQANTSTHQMRMENLPTPEPEEADVSRFSWTTYTATEPGSPMQEAYDGSPVPPLPTHVPPPIFLRKRPIPAHTYPVPYVNSNAAPYINSIAAVSNASIVSRKPVPAADRNRSPSMVTIPSTEKSLPQCPPELEASDKVSTLQARLDDLARRKRNNKKIQITLTQDLRRNAVAYTVIQRKDLEGKLINVDDEMSEIVQEEHEVGLRLYRAQKKRDREENNTEPTSLWIKRVTS